MSTLTLAFVFAAVFLFVLGVNLVLADISAAHHQQLQLRLVEENRLLQMERAKIAMQHQDLFERAAEEAAVVEHRKPLREQVGMMIEQAGLRIRPAHLVVIGTLLATGTGLAFTLATRSIVAGVLLAPFAGCLPFLWVRSVRANRLKKLQSQLPDALDLMSRTMRAGQTISQALQTVADEVGTPLSEEFGYCYDQQSLGMSPEAAMHDLSRRTGLLEVKVFVLAVVIHRQTGGNLSELLEKLSVVIRNRHRIQGMISALTAEGKLQAYVLLALPLFLLVALFIVNRAYVMELFDHPFVLVTMFGFMMLGALWMNRIIHFDY